MTPQIQFYFIKQIFNLLENKKDDNERALSPYGEQKGENGEGTNMCTIGTKSIFYRREGDRFLYALLCETVDE